MARSSPIRWIAACAGAALLLVVVVLVLAKHAKETRAAQNGAAGTTGLQAGNGGGALTATACSIPTPTLLRAMPDAESPPVILWAVGNVRLFLDGKAAFSPPEDPKRFAPGEHELRIEAPGRDPIVTRIRLASFVPALIHAQDDGDAGLTLLRLGVVCTSCEAPVTAFTGFEGGKCKVGTTDALLAQAAALLREDKWEEASIKLGGMPAKVKTRPLYHRLASAIWLDAGLNANARTEANALRGPDAHDVDTLLARLDVLAAEEKKHSGEVVMARWNKVTEQHSALLRTADGVEGLDLRGSEQRMEKLSAAFNTAVGQKSVTEQERVFAAAEETTRALLQQLVDARKNDCVLRAKIATALAGDSP